MKYLPFALLFLATAAGAVANPDAPRYVDAFHQRMAPYHERIVQGQTTLAMDQAGVAMAKALDNELNAAYRKLMTRLSPEQKSALRASQRQWLKYRDAEYAFLNQAFTRESHGSSSVLTVGSARNALVYERVEELWSYLEQL
ncbi:lysozyme inhibitor LprI family protein [Salinisphaera aquimarina]|uniref:Lysozyme inhibitor LprI family protein n=1 Tax=Salinisphaera aquimarina TaxID=2094031 RepID=A0ABV7EPG7_9GAMM